MTLISVVISAPDSKTRFNEVSEMFNYGFNNYRINKIVEGNKPLDFTVDVRGANNEKLQVCAQNDIIIFSRKDVKRSFEYDFIPSTAKFKAPINKNDILGKLVIYENGIEVASVNVIALNDVKECSYLDYLIKCLSNWFIV
jgi:D-alanyl-D-alanine carboxypeptidase (penicillin-binding protein 5/6)